MKTDRTQARDDEALDRLAEFDPGCDLSGLRAALADSRAFYRRVGADPYARSERGDPMETPDPTQPPEAER